MEQILLGDFNLHHPLWGGLAVRRTHADSEDLVAIIEDFNLSNTLPPGTITFEEGNGRLTIDLCLITIGLVDRVISSDIAQALDYNSDYLLISTVLDMTIYRGSDKSRRNYKRLDVKAYKRALKDQLPALRRPITKRAIDYYVQEIVEVIKRLIEQITLEIVIVL
jgi:hypothetical protein